jgi:GNAT superfamily N-acetyltransferase
VTINDEPVTSSGAFSLIYAAMDELDRRYGGPGDEEHDHHLSLDELGAPRGAFLVARRRGDLVGGVGLRSILDPARRLGEVKRLWVRPDLRRTGIARALMDAVVHRARDLGYERLYLETGWAQPEAQALYPALGWTPVAQFPDGAWSYPDATRFTMPL